MTLHPKFVTFDCDGTLTDLQIAEKARQIFGPRLAEPAMARFIKTFAADRLEEITGGGQPYNAVERSCHKSGVPFSDDEANRCYGYTEIGGISGLPGAVEL